MTDAQENGYRPRHAGADRTHRRGMRRFGAATVVGLLVVMAGAAGAGFGFRVRGGEGNSHAALNCRGGMSHLSHVFSEDSSIFPGDPETMINVVFTVAADGFLLEEVSASTHTNTHFDAPAHFIEGARTVDQVAAEELVWPAYVIDVRDRIAADGGDFQLSVDDVEDYEDEHGTIPLGALVILQTGFEDKFGTPAYVDDDAPGFTGPTVQWMFDTRGIKAVGSDTLGPDASTDGLFDATYTTLLNDGFTIPGLTNLDSLGINSDIVLASPVRLIDGSGYQVAPLACHAG